MWKLFEKKNIGRLIYKIWNGFKENALLNDIYMYDNEVDDRKRTSGN